MSSKVHRGNCPTNAALLQSQPCDAAVRAFSKFIPTYAIGVGPFAIMLSRGPVERLLAERDVEGLSRLGDVPGNRFRPVCGTYPAVPGTGQARLHPPRRRRVEIDECERWPRPHLLTSLTARTSRATSPKSFVQSEISRRKNRSRSKLPDRLRLLELCLIPGRV